MLKTHTGSSIYFNYVRLAITCGAWSVPKRDFFDNRPGRARQMRRMVAKARRRERRGYVPPAVKRARAARESRFLSLAQGTQTAVIVISPGDYSTPFVLPDGARFPVDDEPETEFERAAVNVARDDVARGDVMSLDDAKVSLAGGECS